MKKMFRRRAATRAGKLLNDVSRFIRKQADADLVTAEYAQNTENAVRMANQVMYQYFLIPRNIREEYFREELVQGGVPVPDIPEGRV